MRAFSVSILLALLVNAHAELNQADLDDTTLGVVGMQRYQQNIRIPQQRVNSFPYKPIQAPQLNPQPLSMQYGYRSGSSMIARAEEEAAAEAAPEAPEAPAPAPVPEPAPNMNVFGTKLEDCGPEVCGFSAESPKMCIGVVPRQRTGAADPTSADARSFELQKPDSQMMWSSANKAECVPMWSWAEETGTNFMAWLTYGNSDLIPKCNALPAGILASQYTMDTYSTCEYEARDYKYVSKSSSKWTSDNSVTTKNDPFFLAKNSLGQKPVPKMSTKCERFREVIDGICNICAVQGSSTATLTSQCEKLQSTAPSVEDTRAGKWLPFKVFKRGMPWKGMGASLFTENVGSVPTAAVIGLLMSSAVIFAMRRRRTSTEAQEPLLPTSS